MKPWTQTYTGLEYVYEAPTVDMICIEDIAHALSQINRYTGHTRYPYSVAQHCVLCARQAPDEAKLWALLHDACEAYVGDVASPLKRLLPAYAQYEALAEKAICDAVGYHPSDKVRRMVHEVDMRMLMTEKAQLLAQEPKPWGIPYEPYKGLVIQSWSPQDAETAYKVCLGILRH